MQRALLFLIFSILFSGQVKGQIKIGDNPQNIDATSVLELESNSRVLVITRINTEQMNAIVPSAGAIVYNTDLQCIHYYDGALWINVCEEVGGIPNLTTDPLINTNSTIVITPNGENNHIEVAPNSIRTEQIVDGGINGDDIQDNSIGQSKIGNDAVGRNEIAENAVGLEALDTDQITLSNFNNTPGFITGAEIVSNVAGNVLTDNGGAYYDNSAILNSIVANTAAIAADGDTSLSNELITSAVIDGNDLVIIEQGIETRVPLDAFNNTGSDSQNLSLAGNNLSIDNGNTVNLSGFLDNTDNQSITNFSFNPATNIITLILQNGGTDTIDLSSISGTGTDDQQLTLTGGNILTLESGGTVDLNPFLDNVDTDDQTITAFNFNNATNILTITLESGNTQNVDLSALAGGGGTDDQNLTLAGNVLGIEDGNTIDLTPILGSGGTDDQQLSLAGNILTLEDGGTPINLAAFLDNTDDQTLTLAGNTIQIEDGNTIDLTPILGGVDTDDQNLSLAGNVLNIDDGTGVDLTPILGGGGTDDQEAFEVPFTSYLTINSLDVQGAIQELKDELSAAILLAGAPDPTDELITSFVLNGTGLDIAEGANILPSVDLNPTFATDAELAALPIDDADADPANEIQAIASADGSVTITPTGVNDFDLSVATGSDDQNLGTANLVGTDLTIAIEDGNPTTADLSTLATDLELAALSIDDADADPANEIQAIASADGSVTITPTGVNDFDLSVPAGSDDQNLGTATLVGTDLTIAIEDGNPTTADLSMLATDLELAALPIDDADANPANELQAITSGDGSVTITPSGNDFDLSVPGSTDNQDISTDNTPGNIAIDNGS
ncbi:MAG: hypothetical protein GY931_10180, partial [Maribacter sp.]|nr:hypothetical protein [Maribacter sp.]